MPADFFQRVQGFFSQPPYAGIIRVLQVVAGLVVVLSIVGIIVFRQKRKQIEADFKIRSPEE